MRIGDQFPYGSPKALSFRLIFELFRKHVETPEDTIHLLHFVNDLLR